MFLGNVYFLHLSSSSPGFLQNSYLSLLFIDFYKKGMHLYQLLRAEGLG